MIDLKKTSYHQGARGFSEAYADACQEDAVIDTYFFAGSNPAPICIGPVVG